MLVNQLLYQRARISAAEQVRIVIGYRSGQFQVQIIYHARAAREELRAKSLPRIVDGLAERFVKIAAATGRLHDVGVIQADLRRLHARETLRPQMDLLLGGRKFLPRGWRSEEHTSE